MEKDLHALVDSAMRGSAELYGEKPSYSQLARVIGVVKNQPGRWKSGEAHPRRRSMRCLQILSELEKTIESARRKARKKLIELDLKGHETG